MTHSTTFFGDGVFIIAEVGNNHEGDFALAQDMVGLAAETGADAVKFQTIVPERLVNKSDEPRLSTLKKFAFPTTGSKSFRSRRAPPGILSGPHIGQNSIRHSIRPSGARGPVYVLISSP